MSKYKIEERGASIHSEIWVQMLVCNPYFGSFNNWRYYQYWHGCGGGEWLWKLYINQCWCVEHGAWSQSNARSLTSQRHIPDRCLCGLQVRLWNPLLSIVWGLSPQRRNSEPAGFTRKNGVEGEEKEAGKVLISVIESDVRDNTCLNARWHYYIVYCHSTSGEYQSQHWP